MTYAESDPRRHTLKIKGMLEESMRHIRQEVEKVSDPKAQALFETSAEVLGGLITAYDHFEQRSEAAWKRWTGDPGRDAPISSSRRDNRARQE